MFLPVVRFTSVMFKLPVIKTGKETFTSMTLMASIKPTDALSMSTSSSIPISEMFPITEKKNRYTVRVGYRGRYF